MSCKFWEDPDFWKIVSAGFISMGIYVGYTIMLKEINLQNFGEAAIQILITIFLGGIIYSTSEYVRKKK
jgi:hypothetical protein